MFCRRIPIRLGRISCIAVAMILTLQLFLAPSVATAAPPPPAEPDRLPRLVLVGPAQPLAIPLAYIVSNDRLADIAVETKLVIAENPDQTRAIVMGGGEGHFFIMPSNVAATMYNRGVPLRMLDISIWGVLYVVSTDPEVRSLADLRGKEVVVPFTGDMPDLVFRHICHASDIDTSVDLEIYQANTPQQAAQLVLTGRKDHAVLTEPLVTQVLMNAKQSGVGIYRAIDLQVEWGRATGLGERIPIGGAVALPSILGNSHAISRFMEEYQLAVEWLKQNPDAAGQLAAEVEELGFQAGPVAESIRNTRWDWVRTIDAAAEIQAFFAALSQLDPGVVGGKLPDDGLFYADAEF